jgi:flavin reductase (DIM6/NTAB) family NADH-FMN oxidoreductase RutF
MKDTARNILREKEFVIHGVDKDNVTEINKTAASLSPEESEISLTELTLTDSQSIRVPGIMESKVRMECILETSLSLGNDEGTTTDLLIGRILRFHIHEDIHEAGRIDPLKLEPMSRLAGISYAGIGEIVSLERPE